MTRCLRFGSLSTLLVAALLLASPCLAQESRTEALPTALEGLGIFPQPGAELPLDLNFVSSDRDTVRLGDLFENGRPVILTLVYYNCPMLCNLFLDGFVTGLRDLEWTAGQEFDIVTLSIDPREGPASADFKKSHQIENYGRPSAASGWHYLVGEEDAIRQVADAVGFKYAFDAESGEYLHAAGLFVLMPSGTVSQTLFGVEYDARTLRLSLVEASEGQIGSILDHVLLFCFNYDSESGRYTPAAWAIMRLGVSSVAIALAAMFIILWYRGKRRGRMAFGGTPS